MRELTPEEVMAADGGFRLLDVREPWEFDGPLGHIAESALLPLGQVERSGADWLAADPEGGVPLLVCRSGKRSADACRMLERLGAADTVNLAGGMIAWNQAGLEVERTEPASLDALLEEIFAWIAHVRADHVDAVRAALDAERGTDTGPLAPGEREVVARLIDFVERRFADHPPADGSLCISAFRRSLEGL